MKLGRYSLLLFLIFISLPAFAQQGKVDVTGVIIEEGNKEPIEQATVRLLNVKDSAMVAGVVSSRNGGFTLKNIKAGSYLLHITFVGFEPLYQPLRITGKTNPMNVGKLELSDGAFQLGEAVIVGKAPEVVVRNDTVEYNADSYKVTEGSVLEDLLKKMPGVEIDSDGKVTVNGKEVKKVMIDGKEFFSDDPKVASKNLPAKMIDKVQVLDKKSDMALMTGFDDGDEETVINLTVKPGMKQGWFGNAYAGYGSKNRYEGNAMVNRFINNDQITFMGGLNNTNNMGFSDLASTMFSGMGGRRGGRGGGGAGNGITTSGNAGLNFSKEFNPKMTLGGNARFSHSDNDAESKSKKTNILANDSSTIENTHAFSNTKSDNIGASFRLEWKPDTLTNIIFTPDFGYSKSYDSESQVFATTTNKGDSVQSGKSDYFSEGEGYNLSATLEYSRKLNNEGRVFSASLSGGLNDSYNQGMNFSNTDYFLEDRNQLIDQRFRYDNNSYNYRAFASWVEPIGHNNFLQATYSFSQREQKSLKSTYSRDDEGDGYNKLDTAYSKSFRNNFTTQRISLSFKAQRAKYNYTIGMNMDPSYSHSKSFVGDSTFDDRSRRVLNFSPMAQFNYMFDKRTNLRVMYNGRTSQPSMTQLQPVADLSDPQNTIIGNPDLNPSYTHNMYIRFQKFVPEKQRAFMIMANANYIMNDIVTKTTYADKTSNRVTTYENVNGNYNANVRVMLNTPLRNKKFSVNTMTMASFANSNGFINGEKNTNQNLILQERAGIDFRSSIIDLGVNGNIRYNGTTNTLQAQQDLQTLNYGVGGTTTIYLPLDFKVESDITYSTNSGYADGYKQKEVLWNASASKSFLKNNQGTLRFKIYDILRQRSNISRSTTASYTTDTEHNTLSSYFMVHFIYRFSIFKGGATASDAMRGGRGYNRGSRSGGHRF